VLITRTWSPHDYATQSAAPAGDIQRRGLGAFCHRLRPGSCAALGGVHGHRRRLLDGAERRSAHVLQLDAGPAQARGPRQRRRAKPGRPAAGSTLPTDARAPVRGLARMPAPALKALAFNCSLKSAGGREKSSTDVLLRQLLDALATHG